MLSAGQLLVYMSDLPSDMVPVIIHHKGMYRYHPPLPLPSLQHHNLSVHFAKITKIIVAWIQDPHQGSDVCPPFESCENMRWKWNMATENMSRASENMVQGKTHVVCATMGARGGYKSNETFCIWSLLAMPFL
jgi:hypothetical protein